MFKVSRANSSGRKKGILALEALIGTIVSVIALVILIGFFADLLPQYNNEEIAKNNAKSIGEFVNYFQTDLKYSSLNKCFNILRLDYQTNFQYEKEGSENFFYLISEEGIYLLSLSDFVKFEEDLDNNVIDYSSYENIINFEEKVILYYDNTDEISLNWFTSIFFLTDNLNLDLTPLKKELNDAFLSGDSLPFYILKPNIITTTDKIGYYIFTPGTSNNYDVIIQDNSGVTSNFFIGEFDSISKSSYLVYSNDYNGDKMLFVTNSKYSLPQIKRNLCSQDLFSKTSLKDFYKDKENIENVDYINNEIIFSTLSDTSGNNYEFEWRGEAICKINNVETSCSDVFDINEFQYYDFNGVFRLSYKNFIYEIKNLLKNKKIIPIDLEITKISTYVSENSEIYFEDLFIRFNMKETTISNILDSNFREKNKYFDITSFNNDIVNDCEETICNIIKYDNLKIYFYAGGADFSDNKIENFRMYSFNELFLRKEEFNTEGKNPIIYLNNIPVEYRKISTEKDGFAWFWQNEEEPYIYELLIKDINVFEETKDIKIFLSLEQFTNIPKYSSNTGEVIFQNE